MTDATTGTILFFHGDHLGSASVMTDYSGTEYQRLQYFPYGGTRYDSLPTDKSVKHRFTGHEKDFDIGIYYAQARYYDQRLARFISCDPAGPQLADPQTLNPYSYCRNNPVRYVDPKGELFEQAKLLFDIAWMQVKEESKYVIAAAGAIANDCLFNVYVELDADPANLSPEGAQKGHELALILGILETGAGIADAAVGGVVIGGGVATSPTGVGALGVPAGVVIAGAGVGVAAHGLSVSIIAGYNLKKMEGKGGAGNNTKSNASNKNDANFQTLKKWGKDLGLIKKPFIEKLKNK